MSTANKYYSTCEECPLSVFIKCLETEDLSKLIIQGKPDPVDLAMAWANLFAEFIDLSQDGEQMYVLHLQRNIKLVGMEIYEIETVLYFIQPVMLPFTQDRLNELLAILKDYDYPHEFDVTSPDYLQSLQTIENRLASRRLQFNMMVKEFNDYAEERGLDSFDANYFTRQLARLSKFQGYNLRAKDITVLEFIVIDQEYQRVNTKIENEES